MKNYLFCIVIFASLCGHTMPASGQEQARFSRRIIGYVKDREDHPVARAEVCANPHGPIAGRLPCAMSKTDGSFSIEVWWPDTYTISAESRTQGYPDARSGFYGIFFGELPVMTVDEFSELKPVEVRIGPQAGRIIFQILDDESGREIESGAVKLCRTDNPQMCWDMSTAFPKGKYELLTPEVPFTIKFGIWGSNQELEERSAFDETGGLVEVLQMELGTRKKMIVRLRRVQANK